MFWKNSFSLFALTFTLSMLFFGCSKSDDQRKFEQEAFRPPKNITEMDPSGNQGEQTDADDWRTSPDFAGLVRVEKPAYPNPVIGERITIEIFIGGLDAVPGNRMEVYAFRFLDQEFGPIATQENVSTGLTAFTINRGEIADPRSNQTPDLYRLLIYDGGRRNLITYGDVRIQ